MAESKAEWRLRFKGTFSADIPYPRWRSHWHRGFSPVKHAAQRSRIVWMVRGPRFAPDLKSPDWSHAADETAVGHFEKSPTTAT
jgi:hypothetical protein